MRREWLAVLCLCLALASGCAPSGPAAPADGAAEIPAEKLIAITFDDGPRRDTTERLLDGLRTGGPGRPSFSSGVRSPAARIWWNGWPRRVIRWAATPGTMCGS